jgi:hypothetical protein
MKVSQRVKNSIAAISLVAAGAVGTVVASNVVGTDVKTIPDSVASDCSKDVTVQFNAFAAASGPRQLKANGCYLVGPNSKFQVTGQLDGRGATIRRDEVKFGVPDPKTRHPGFLSVGSGGSLSNLKLERIGKAGYDPDHYDEHGVEVRGASNVDISNIKMTNIKGDCLYFQGASQVDVKDVDCVSNGRQGGAISRGNDVHIDGFIVRNSPRSGFDFEANSVNDTLTNIEIENFDFTTGLIAFPSQGYNSKQDNIWIHDGVVRDALSFVYDRQVRPSQDNCQGSVQRQNWKVENVDVSAKVGEYGGKGQAVFCGTKNVTVRNVNMPNGYVTFEGSSGNLLVEDTCAKGVRAVAGTGTVTQRNNSNPPCDGTVPPTTKPPVTTKPPSSTTTTTRPPVTTPPTTRPPLPNVTLTHDECIMYVAVLANERALLEAIVPRPADAIRLSDAVHDNLKAKCA